MTTFNRYKAGSPLFLPAQRGVDPARSAYLLPSGAVTPDSFGIGDALVTYSGWFMLFDSLDDAQLDALIVPAQTFFSNSARIDALIAWFTNADNPSQGLTGWVITASRANNPITIGRPSLIEFANFAINFTPGTTIVASGDGNGLTFVCGGTENTLAVTPFGARNPIELPMTTSATLCMLSPPVTQGCLTFDLALDDATAVALDLGLRAFTAPMDGGYAATARLPVFELADLPSGPLVGVALDPLAPLDHVRSFMSFVQSGVSVPSTYRTPVGGKLSLTPGADATLVFCERLTGVNAQGEPVAVLGNQVLYVVPSGTFSLTATDVARAVETRERADGIVPDLSESLMCGLSAVEYLSYSAGATLLFTPDQSAFAPTLKAADTKSGAGRVFGQLSDTAKTSWAFLIVQGGASYYAQPDSAVLYQSAGAASPFLSYLPLVVGTLQRQVETHASTAGSQCFPLLPYANATADTGISLDDLAQFELQVLAPTRRMHIQKMTKGFALENVVRQDTDPPTPSYGTTPQGLLLQFGASASWEQLTVAVSPSATIPPNRQPRVLLGDVSGELKDAIQTNQLFLVTTVGDLFTKYASIHYSLTQERLNALKAANEDPDVISRLQLLVPSMWADESALNVTLQGVLTPEEYAAELTSGMIRSYTGDFSLFVAGWEFDLSPWRWADHKSMLIFKFCKKQLSQLVSDTSQWAQADSFNSASIAAQQQIGAIFSDALTRYASGAGDNDLAYFVNTVMSDASWNGILVLNATVPLSGLPPQMEGLAAGIDPAQFRAHHIGINVTPVQLSATTSSAMPSSVFALIDYEDPAPLVSSDDYQFKVNSLKVLIANSNIASFSSRIELLINTLFGEPVQQLGAPDNNLIFNGYYQQSGGIGSYTFITAAETAFRVTSAVLYQVGIASARFVTVTDNSNDPNNTTSHSYFGLTGAISFLPQPGFDFFSYGPEQAEISSGAVGGGLNYTDLSINMTFDEATPTYKQFAFDLSRIVVNAADSQVRSASLAAHFPMKLTTVSQGLGTVTPDSLGFMPVDSPVQGSDLSAPWYGLRFELDLGSPGALAADIGFTAGLLLGWAPNPSSPTVYIGLSLPGVSGGQRAISLEGILSLTFGDVLFIAQAPTYILQLSDIALKLLSLSFPPNGQVNLLMFGNPDAPTSGALGWYASYLKNGAGQANPSSRRLTLVKNDTKQLPRSSLNSELGGKQP